MNNQKIIEMLYKIISEIPVSKRNEESDADAKAGKIVEGAAVKAAVISAGFSIPAGPVGFFTILPDLTGIWKLQRNMVADIAAVYGKKSMLNRDQMLYCLFRHSVSQVVRDVVIKAATRVTVEQGIAAVVEQILKRIGIHIARKTSSKFISRSIPLIGTFGAGAYAFFDTKQVGKTAMELFSGKAGIAGTL